jgi:hypothetical protein
VAVGVPGPPGAECRSCLGAPAFVSSPPAGFPGSPRQNISTPSDQAAAGLRLGEAVPFNDRILLANHLK